MGLSLSSASPLHNRIFAFNTQSPPSHQIFGGFWFSSAFPMILHHSFLHLDAVFPEQVRTVF